MEFSCFTYLVLCFCETVLTAPGQVFVAACLLPLDVLNFVVCMLNFTL